MTTHPGHYSDSDIVCVILGAVIALVVAFLSLNWVFRDAEESTESYLEFYHQNYLPWWGTKFGLWLGLCGLAGWLACHGLQQLWAWVKTKL